MRKSLLVPILLAAALLVGCGGSNNDFYDDYYSYDPGPYYPPINPPVNPPGNGYPVTAYYDSYTLDFDTILDVSEYYGVLANDDFLTGDAYADFPLRTQQGGWIEGYTDGAFTYEPPFGFTGNDQFEYTLVGRDGQRDTAMVYLTVYAAP